MSYYRFNEYLNRGFHILYSGNPCLMTADLLIIPDLEQRKQRLKKRGQEGGYVPSDERFDDEEASYRKASIEGTKIIVGDIPSPDEIRSKLK